MKQEIIMIDQPDLVRPVTVTLWQGKKNNSLWKDEQTARRESCTHDYCECGEIKKIYSGCCDRCSAKQEGERFLARPRKKLSEMEPEDQLMSERFDDWYVGDLGDMKEQLFYHNENQEEDEPPVTLKDARIVICRPVYLDEIELHMDDAPEDFELPSDSPIHAALENLNEVIRESKTLLYYTATKFALDLKGLE